MGQGGVRIEAVVLHLVKAVYAVGEHLAFYTFQLVAGHYGFQLAAQACGQGASLGEKFEAYIGNLAVFIFKVNDEIILV